MHNVQHFEKLILNDFAAMQWILNLSLENFYRHAGRRAEPFSINNLWFQR